MNKKTDSKIQIWGWDKKPRTMRRYLKRGDIFCFRYDDSRYCFGRIIERDEKSYCIVEIFDYVSDTPEISVEQIEKAKRLISPDTIDDYCLFDRKMDGEWRIIGHHEDYRAVDYDNIYLTFGIENDWKKKDLYGNITKIPPEERHKYILHRCNTDYYVKEILKPILGEPNEEKDLKQKDVNVAIKEERGMDDRVRLQELDDCISVSFDAGDEKIMAIGAKMQERCEAAYMNGYNWEAFLNAYLEQNAPDILEELDSDPEAEMYSVYINDTGDAGKVVAEKLKKILDDLFNNEDDIYSFLEQYGDEIEWD